MPAGARPASGLKDRQKISLICRVVAVRGAPADCNPSVEIRVGSEINADDIKAVARPAQTSPRRGGELNETIMLGSAVFEASALVHVIVWDYSGGDGRPCGRASLPIGDALKGAFYNPKASSQEAGLGMEQTLDVEGKDAGGFTAVLRFGFWEHSKVTVKVDKAHKLPYMDLIGTIDGQVELRLVNSDMSRERFPHTAGEESLWHAETEVVSNTTEPVWAKKFHFPTSGDPRQQLLVILWDDDTPMPATPVGVVSLPIGDILAGQPESEQERKLKLLQVVGEDKVDGLNHARLIMHTSWKPALHK